MDVIRNTCDQVIAIIYRNEDWQDGLSFPTPESMFIQAGCWQYSAGKELRAHFHRKYERTSTQTQEVVFVKNGSMEIHFYNEHHERFDSVTVNQGDFVVIGDVGHGYKILEEKTQILEIKNGPFFDVSKDKEFIRNPNGEVHV